MVKKQIERPADMPYVPADERVWGEVIEQGITVINPDGTVLMGDDEEGELGGPGSGHWGHSGNPPSVGGSTAGGGLRRIGASQGSTRDVRQAHSESYREKRERLKSVVVMSSEILAETATGVKRCQAHGLSSGNEQLYGIGRDGNMLGEVRGDKNSVAGEKASDLCYDSYVTVHNHPSSSSFSHMDINTFLYQPKAQHMVVIGHDGTLYTLSKPVDWEKKLYDVEKIYYREWDNILGRFNQQVKDGANSYFTMKTQTHEVVTATARVMGLVYHRVEVKK